jgi:hypothetical protein
MNRLISGSKEWELVLLLLAWAIVGCCGKPKLKTYEKKYQVWVWTGSPIKATPAGIKSIVPW